jgi:hypothetical protein
MSLEERGPLAPVTSRTGQPQLSSQAFEGPDSPASSALSPDSEPSARKLPTCHGTSYTLGLGADGSFVGRVIRDQANVDPAAPEEDALFVRPGLVTGQSLAARVSGVTRQSRTCAVGRREDEQFQIRGRRVPAEVQ